MSRPLIHAPFRSRFLSEQDLMYMEKYNTHCEPPSLIGYLSKGATYHLAKALPPNLSPNVLAFTSLLCALHSFHCALHQESSPMLLPVASWLLLVMYQFILLCYDAQCQRTRNDSVLGFILRVTSDTLSCPFIAVTLCRILPFPFLRLVPVQWYIVQCFTLYYLWEAVTFIAGREKRITGYSKESSGSLTSSLKYNTDKEDIENEESKISEDDIEKEISPENNFVKSETIISTPVITRSNSGTDLDESTTKTLSWSVSRSQRRNKNKSILEQKGGFSPVGPRAVVERARTSKLWSYVAWLFPLQLRQLFHELLTDALDDYDIATGELRDKVQSSLSCVMFTEETKCQPEWRGLFNGPREGMFIIELRFGGINAIITNFLDWVQRYYPFPIDQLRLKDTLPLLKQFEVSSEPSIIKLKEVLTRVANAEVVMSIKSDPSLKGLAVVQILYYFFLVVFLVAVTLRLRTEKQTRNQLLASMVYRSIPSLAYRMGLSVQLGMEDVVSDGLFLCILIADLHIARIAKRPVHDWMTALAMMSVLGVNANGRLIIFAETLFYFGSIIYDTCMYLNLPLFTLCTNVYIDGVFDLCHLGHKRHVNRALLYGNRLFVGVMGDEDCKLYKRPPVMNMSERIAELEALRHIYKVIPNAPCFGLTREFIDKYNIHIVLASPEYDKEEDKYYKVPREMGILRFKGRTDGISTSEIIERIAK